MKSAKLLNVKRELSSTNHTPLPLQYMFLTNCIWLRCLFMPVVGLMVRVVGLGSQDPEFKSHSAVELIPDGVHSACHPEVGKMSASFLVSRV